MAMMRKISFAKKVNVGKKGFTIVEVLVVLVLLAILASILIPSVLAYINKGQDSACKTVMAMVSRGIRSSIILNTGEPLGNTQLAEELEENYGVVLTRYGNIRGVCPGGGTYSVELDDNEFTLTCSIHGSLECSDLEVALSHVDILQTLDSFMTCFAEDEEKMVESIDFGEGAAIKENFCRILALGNNADFDFSIYYNPEDKEAPYLMYFYSSLQGLGQGDIVSVTKIRWNEKNRSAVETVTGTAPVTKKIVNNVEKGLQEIAWVIRYNDFTAAP